MRDFIIILVIIGIIFGGSYGIESYLEKTEEDLITKLDVLQKEIDKGNMEQLEEIKDLISLWGSTKENWNILANHQSIDDIEIELKKFVKNYEMKEEKEASLNLVTIRVMINDMHKGEMFTITNIL